MCMTCVAQGGPYVVGSLVALQAMAASARRRRRAGIAVDATCQDAVAEAAPARSAG